MLQSSNSRTKPPKGLQCGETFCWKISFNENYVSERDLVTRFNREFAILLKGATITFDVFRIRFKVELYMWRSFFSNDREIRSRCVGKCAFKVGLRLIHVAALGTGNPAEFHGNVRRLSRRENRLSTLGIPFRFLKYTAGEYRERNVSTVSIAYAHNADCPLVPSFHSPSRFSAWRTKKKKERGTVARHLARPWFNAGTS